MTFKTKLTLAAGFVGAVALAAAAFGQTGGSNDAPTTAPTPNAARRGDAPQRREAQCGRIGPRATRRVVHGELKVARRQGAFADVTIDTGEITAIDHGAKTVTIKRLDGRNVTATAVDRTRVCLDGNAATFDALKVGDGARLMQVRSDRFTGLRRIAAVSPNAAGTGAPSGFQGEDPSSADEAA
jgi:hypothetical protein